MGDVKQAAAFAAALYMRRLDFAYHGYLRRDPMSRLHLRIGRDNPYAIYDGLRRQGTLVPTRIGNYVTTSHHVCNAVLRDRRFGVRAGEFVPGDPDEFLSFLNQDPPDHTRLRRLVQPAFSPKQMAGYRARIERRVDDLLDRAGPEFDLVRSFAAPLPIAVITDLLGIPDADADRFARYGADVGGALDGIRSLGHAAQVQAASIHLRTLFAELFELRRRRPADDVVSRVVAAEGTSVRPEEMVPMCNLLLLAGFETTVNLIGNAVNALLQHPAQWADLCADPAGLAPAVVEETLRWDPPVQRTARCAKEDVPLEGRTVAPGEFVITLLGAANRDPEVYEHANRFDIHRRPDVDHLAFSSGIHYCVGAPLARMEAAIALQKLAERMPDLRRAGPLRRRVATVVRGPIRLPVRTTGARGNVVAPA